MRKQTKEKINNEESFVSNDDLLTNDFPECVKLVEERRLLEIRSLDPPKKALTAYTLFVKVVRLPL